MKVGFIGCGKMGEAILADLFRSGKVVAGDVCVCEADPERRDALKSRYEIHVFPEYAPVLRNADMVFLAVKPQNLDAVLSDIATDAEDQSLFISIAAGKRLAHIESLLPNRKIVRVMPNLAALVSEGMSVFCAGGRVDEKERTGVGELLSCFGRVLELPEHHFDAVTALSGSGPAFFAYFLKAMTDAAAELGLSREDAGILAVQTMLGSAKLLARGLFDAESLIAAVSSARGTTVAGMAVLDDSPVKEVVARTLRAAAERSRELSA